MRKTSLIACAAVLAAAPLFAVSYQVPTDRELIARADIIALATAIESHSELTQRGAVVTVTTLHADDLLKGDVGTDGDFRVVELGGVNGGVASFVPGVPTYDAGTQYLVFTDTNADGDSITWGMGIGRFVFGQRPDGSTTLSHGNAEMFGFDSNLQQYVDVPRDANLFITYIRGMVAGNIDPSPKYFLPSPLPAGPQATVTSHHDAIVAAFNPFGYLMTSGGQGFRWQNPTAGFVLSGTEGTLNGSGSASQGVNAWNSVAAVHYSIAGQDNTALGGLRTPDGKNGILFNDPNSELPAGVDGLGGISLASSTYSWSGTTVWNPSEVDVVIGKATNFPNQSCLNSVMTHEIGHTLGLRHADKLQDDSGACSGSLDCSSAAIMTAITPCSYNGALQPWDVRAIQAVYGASTTTTPPPSGGTSGDVNGDGVTNSSDVFYLVNYLFAGGPAPKNGHGDVNGDGAINAGDVFYLINYLFAGGPAPH